MLALHPHKFNTCHLSRFFFSFFCMFGFPPKKPNKLFVWLFFLKVQLSMDEEPIPDAPWPPPSYAMAPPRACCLIDGYEIECEFRFPNSKKGNGEFTFDE